MTSVVPFIKIGEQNCSTYVYGEKIIGLSIWAGQALQAAANNQEDY